jgi:hypothetical protein
MVEQFGPVLSAPTTIIIPAAACVSTAACNVSTEQPSDGGQRHALTVISGARRGVALTAAYRIRRKEPFHALKVSRRCAVSLVHVTTTDPLRGRRHADLVADSVIASCCPYCVCAMAMSSHGITESLPHGFPTLS